MKKIYTKDISVYSDPKLFAADYALMPAYRKEKIDAYKFQNGKYLSLGVGVLLREALMDLGIVSESEPSTYADLQITYNENGKPFLKDFPEIYFSLSHSEERAMCVVADTPVGCDVQFHENKSTAMIADKFYTDEEKALPFYDVWALKESYIKAAGLSLGIDFKTIPIKTNADYTLELLDLEDNYSWAVCTKNK